MNDIGIGFDMTWLSSLARKFKTTQVVVWILLCHLLWPNAWASDFNKSEVKTALVGHIINNIEWQHSAGNISILVYQNADVYNQLKILEKIKLKNKPVAITLINTLTPLTKGQVVYIPEQQSQSLSDITSSYRGSNTLIITENSPMLHNVMINIVEDKQAASSTFKFQINRPNLTFEMLQILPDLVLYGGSELDVAKLYRQTESAIKEMREQNLSILNQLSESQAELVQKEQALALLEAESRKRSIALIEQEQTIIAKEQLYQELSTKVMQVNQNYDESIALIEQKEKELGVARADYAMQQSEIQLQLQVLNKLKSEVKENETLLKTQSSQLQKSKQEVQDQAKQIEKKDTIIGVVSGGIIIALIGGLSIALLLVRIKRINDKLNQAVLHLENTQSQLVKSEKMASLGQLVAGVAHELNTPLGISLTAVSTMGGDAQKLEELMANSSLRKSDLTDYIEKAKELDYLVRHNLERCHKLIQSFKQVSSDQIVAEIRPIYLQDYVKEVMLTLSVLLQKHQVNWRIDGGNPLIEVDPGILSQIINNLTTNAITHAFDGVQDKQIVIHIGQKPGAAEIIFRDNGTGMNEEVRANIFEPFYTTKRGQGGIGLGMNIVFNLVTAKLSGDIEIESEVGCGSQFIISLPS